MELPGAEGVEIVLVTEPLCAIWGGQIQGFTSWLFGSGRLSMGILDVRVN